MGDVREWRDPNDGKWHADEAWWRSRALILLALAAGWSLLMTVLGTWGWHVYSISVIAYVAVAVFAAAMSWRARRRGWRSGGTHSRRRVR